MKKEIVMLKLANNDDIIGEVKSESIDQYVLKNTIQVGIVPSRANPQEMSFGFLPYPQFAPPKSSIELKINKTQIIFVTEPDEQFLEQYNQVFGNIIAPTSKKIILN